MTEMTVAQNTALAPANIYTYDVDEFRRQIKSTSNNISTKGKRFRLPDGTQSPGPMECIILDFVSYNAYYPDVYDPDDIQPPACWAINKYQDDMAPDPDECEAPQADTCADCPKNQWVANPAKPGKRIKGCKNQYRVALVQPTATHDSDILILNVSPTGLKYFDKYLSKLAGSGRHFRQQITKVDWDPNSQQTLTFGSEKTHDIDPTVIAALVNRCFKQKMLYASPIR